MIPLIAKHKLALAITIIWLFHISAIIGVTMGYQNWFISKTPFNLSLSLLLFVWVYPLHNTKTILAFGVLFILGFFAEWLGVTYSLLFGTYAYGSNFGIKLSGVPYLIGAYWAILTFITRIMVAPIKTNHWIKISLAALLMLFLDYFMEHSASIFDYWTFKNNVVPLQNYSTWLVVAFVFQIILHLFKIKGNKTFAYHYYAAQLVFFVYFYFTLS